MREKPLFAVEVSLVVSLLLLAAGALSLRFQADFLAGFGIFAGVTVVALSVEA